MSDHAAKKQGILFLIIGIFLYALYAQAGVSEPITAQNQTEPPAQTANLTLDPPSKVKVISNFPVNEQVVALTFDDGYCSQEHLNKLLNVLDKYNIKATFFLLGEWAKANPALVNEIAQHGHEIANHSNQHPHLSRCDNEKIVVEYSQCKATLENILNRSIAPLFRPPYGDFNNQTINCLNEKASCYIITWNVDTVDWSGASSSKITNTILTTTKNGSIILAHCQAKHTPEGLDAAIPALLEKGYKFITITDGIKLLKAQEQQAAAVENKTK